MKTKNIKYPITVYYVDIRGNFIEKTFEKAPDHPYDSHFIEKENFICDNYDERIKFSLNRRKTKKEAIKITKNILSQAEINVKYYKNQLQNLLNKE